jgi:hypothetical protein
MSQGLLVHYIIAVKDNQPTLAQAIESMFPTKAAGRAWGRGYFGECDRPFRPT